MTASSWQRIILRDNIARHGGLKRAMAWQQRVCALARSSSIISSSSS